MSETNDGAPVTPDVAVQLDVQQSGDGVRVSLRCHPGAVRVENQDRVSTAATPLGRLVLVADGVGGDLGGAETAELAATEYVRFLQTSQGAADPAGALAEATRTVNAEIERRRSARLSPRGMSSTVALVLIRGRDAFVGHLGDSRVYLARGDQFRCLTRDHSVVRQMVERGILSEQEAETHPKAHVLTHSLGQTGVDLEVSVTQLEAGDALLLCSDGLWAYVPESQLRKVLDSAGADPAQAADELLHLALQAGAPDNVSVAVVGIAGVTSLDPTHGARKGWGRWWLIFLLLAFAVAGVALWRMLRTPAATKAPMAPIHRGPSP